MYMMKEVKILRGMNDEKIMFNDYVYETAKELKSIYDTIDFKSVDGFESGLLDCLASATIEGARTDIDTVKLAMKKKVAHSKSTLMVANCVNAIKDIKDKKLTVDSMIHAWRVAVKNVCDNEEVRGKRFRSGMVYVGNHIPAEVSLLEDYMKAMIKYISDEDEDAFIKACITHLYFVYIHPFCDGNGRMARILTDKVIYDSGFKGIYKVPMSDSILEYRQQYYRAINMSEISFGGVINITEFIDYMLQIMILSLKLIKSGQFDSIESKLFKLMKTLNNEEITVAKGMEELDFAESTIRVQLNRMVNKGILIRMKKGRKYIYKIKH